MYNITALIFNKLLDTIIYYVFGYAGVLVLLKKLLKVLAIKNARQ